MLIRAKETRFRRTSQARYKSPGCIAEDNKRSQAQSHEDRTVGICLWQTRAAHDSQPYDKGDKGEYSANS